MAPSNTGMCIILQGFGVGVGIGVALLLLNYAICVVIYLFNLFG